MVYQWCTIIQMACKSVPYRIISIYQNRFFSINYKVISLMFSSKIVDFNEKLPDNGALDITTAQFPSTKPELRSSAGSNPVCSMSEICNGENLTVAPAGNKT